MIDEHAGTREAAYPLSFALMTPPATWNRLFRVSCLDNCVDSCCWRLDTYMKSIALVLQPFGLSCSDRSRIDKSTFQPLVSDAEEHPTWPSESPAGSGSRSPRGIHERSAPTSGR